MHLFPTRSFITNNKNNYKLLFKIPNTNFFRTLSQNPEIIETYCSDLKNPFQFAIRKWCLKNHTKM